MELNITSTTSAQVNITPSLETINIEMIAPSGTGLIFTDVGIQGMRGVQGEKGANGTPLDFEDLTEQQKLELRGDVGDTSTNYTNLFNSVLLS